MNEKEFDRQVRLIIEGGLLQIQRNHLSVHIIRPEKMIQDVKVLYENTSNNENLKLIFLTPRQRKLQRNMKAYDNEGKELIIIPSHMVTKSLERVCSEMAEELIGIEDNDKRKLCECFNKLFEFKFDKNVDYTEEINYVSQIYDKVVEADNMDSIDKMMKLFVLCRIYEYFFYPVVDLGKNEIKPNDLFYIRYTIEHVFHHPKKPFFLNIASNITLGFPVEVEKASNHFRFIAPKGSVIKGYRIEEANNNKITERFTKGHETLDKEMVYIHFPKKKSEEIWKELRGSDVKLKIKIVTGVELSSPLFILTLLPHFFLIPTILYAWHFKIFSDLSYILSTTAIAVALMTSIGLFSLDKPLYQEFIKPHLTINITILAIMWIITFIKIAAMIIN